MAILRMGWIIDTDHLDLSEEFGIPSRVDFGPGLSSDEVEPFRLLDDDGELYYSGRIDSDDVGDEAKLIDPLEWAMHDAGATELQLKENGRWVGVIG